MTFTEFILHPSNLFFSGAVALFFLIGLIQILALFAGLDLAEGVDGFLPEADFEAPGVDGLEAAGLLDALFGWLELRKVPVLISLVLFLLFFGFIGLNLQGAFLSIGLGPLPGWLVIPPVFIASLFPLKYSHRFIARIFPREQTYAISEDAFIGRLATITIGEATPDKAAEARLTGPLGRTHYIMVFADQEGATLTSGTEVLLVGRRESHFTGILNPNRNLSSTQNSN